MCVCVCVCVYIYIYIYEVVGSLLIHTPLCKTLSKSLCITNSKLGKKCIKAVYCTVLI